MKEIIEVGNYVRFQRPLAIWSNNSLIVGHWAPGGCWISKVDQFGEPEADPFKLIDSDVLDDPHNTTSIGIREDGRIIAAYTLRGEAAPQTVRVSISSSPLDTTSWGTEKELPSSGSYDIVSYPQLFYLAGEGRWYLFCRFGIDPSRSWGFITSEDDGETWSSSATLLTTHTGDERPYLQIDSNGFNRIDISMSQGNPQQHSDNSIYHLYYDSGNWFTSGDINLGTPPFDFADLVLVWDGSIEIAWNWDMLTSGANPRMLFDTNPDSGDDNKTYRHARWDGVQWLVSAISGGGTPPLGSSSSSGIRFNRDNPNVVYFSREENGFFEIESMSTTDNGMTWGNRQAITETTDSSIRNIRPIYAEGSGPFHLLWVQDTGQEVSIFADIESVTGDDDDEEPGISFLSPGISNPEVEFKSFDFVTGDLIADLPDLQGSFGRLLGAHTSTDFTLPIPLSGKSALGDIAFQATVPGRTMIVAVINELPAWGGRIVARNGGTDGSLRLATSSLEAYLQRRTVQNHSFQNASERAILRALIGDAGPRDVPGVGNVGGINLELEIEDGNSQSSIEYLKSDRTTVYNAIRERAASENGLEWTIELVWANEERTRVRKILRIAPRIGIAAANPPAIFEATSESVFETLSGNEATYEYDEDYSGDRGATWVEIYSTGEGDDQPTSDPQIATDLIAAGWPIDEYHESLSSTTITDVNVLNSHAIAELALRKNGARVWNITSRWNVFPQLNIDWRLGDDIAWNLRGHRHPNGVRGQGRCIGWELNPEAGTVNPILLDPLSGGA